jgi:hypothetical protein
MFDVGTIEELFVDKRAKVWWDSVEEYDRSERGTHRIGDFPMLRIEWLVNNQWTLEQPADKEGVEYRVIVWWPGDDE